ncbi:MAG: hypothetical protein K2Y22_04295 [Candidatus Obscuribacterales bacterium]|nr:hypothetical protein [Candidatus Obscuribacterales bacterium]
MDETNGGTEMSIDIEAIKERADKATKGPWAWFGNTSVQQAYLATTHSGRIYVMQFRRWGTQDAMPVFQDFDSQTMRPMTDYVVHEVSGGRCIGKGKSKKDCNCYRKDFRKINHPDAEFIAHARTDIPALLDEIERLRKENHVKDSALILAARRFMEFKNLMPDYEFQKRFAEGLQYEVRAEIEKEKSSESSP